MLSEQIFEWAQQNEAATIARIRRLVECESPSRDAAAINQLGDLLAQELTDLAKVKAVGGGEYGNHLIADIDLPGKAGNGRVLVLAHADTVWPLGTLARMPFEQREGRLWGPGVLDMKGGIALFLAAVECLRTLNIPVAHRFRLQVNADEEVGSHSSRALTEKNARASVAVLVLEPGTGLEGKLKTARKGVGDYRLIVRGKASHAGVDFEAGASAVVELARQIERVAALTDLSRGITVNPGVIEGGTRPNVVAAGASAQIDIRVARLRDAAPLDRKLRALQPVNPRCRLQISGGLNRPPMERTPQIRRLFRLAQQHAAALHIDLADSMTGGGSDGNFTAALGIPTLDGLGAVGEGAHAANESILIDRLADRTALLALLLASNLNVN